MTYKRMDVVMVEDRLDKTWSLGIVKEDYNDGDFGVRCEAKTSESSTSFMGGGNPLAEVRPATAEDIANAPEFAKRWLEKQREWEETRLLNERDPLIRPSHREAWISMRDAGIERVSDLERFTNAQLLALPGVGKTSVKKWRAIQQEVKDAQS